MNELLKKCLVMKNKKTISRMWRFYNKIIGRYFKSFTYLKDVKNPF